MREIIDCHSHIGTDWLWGPCDMNKYLELAEKLSITESMLMIAPGLRINGKRIQIYEYKDNQTKYSSEFNGLNVQSYIYNNYLLREIRKAPDSIKIHFIPIIHPYFNDIDYLYFLKERYDVKAFKVHGTAMGFHPGMINKDYIKALKEIDIPIIAHTDVNKTLPEDAIQNMNNPYDWTKFFIDNELKGYITHAARLDFRCFDLINKNDNLVIGIAPDLMIIYNKHRLMYQPKDTDTVLSILSDNVDHNKIMFDVDFSWNVNNGQEKIMDYNQVDRVNNIFNEKDRGKVLSKNARRFFKL